MPISRRFFLPAACLNVWVKTCLMGLLLALLSTQLLAADTPPQSAENGSPVTAATISQSADIDPDIDPDVDSSIKSGIDSSIEPDIAEDPAYPLLPQDLSAWQMALDADRVVKTVIVLLILASLVTWTITIAKSIQLRQLRQQFTQQSLAGRQVGSLQEAAEQADLQTGVGQLLLNAVQEELAMSPQPIDKTGVQERSLSKLARIEAAAVRDMAVGTNALASIGSTSPFIGLFGTVWGIMTAFIGIAETQTTNLAVIAPGLAEALLATALGLVAAIPAVLAYNFFTRWINNTRALLTDLSATLMQLLSRDLERAERTLVQP